MLALILELSLDEAKYVLAALRVAARHQEPQKFGDTQLYVNAELRAALIKAADQLDKQIYGGK